MTLADEMTDLPTESPDFTRFSDMSEIVCSKLPDLSPVAVGVILEIVFSNLLFETDDIDFIGIFSSSSGTGLLNSPEMRLGGFTVHRRFWIGSFKWLGNTSETKNAEESTFRLRSRAALFNPYG